MILEGRFWHPQRGLTDGCVAIGDDGMIKRVAKTISGAKERVCGMLLPAALDMHVHFRDPGFPHKEDWASGSTAAACGGVTAVVDMPNTQPPTDSPAAFADKARRAAAASVVDFGLGVSARPGISREAWFGELPAAFWKLYPYGISWEDYQSTATEVTAAGGRPLVIHGEHPSHIAPGPPRKLAEHTAHRQLAEAECLAGMPASPQLHVAHLSTADGLAGLPAGATAEVCPHHLLLNLDACDSLECKVDPPLQTPRDNTALWGGFRDGRIAVLASDHAPHLPEEKASDAPPSGIPGVETMLPLMLQQAVTGNIELGRLVNAMAEAPADRLGLSRGRIAPGQPADLIEVDSKATRPVVLERLHSRAGWTPYEGWDAIFPHRVWRRGELVAADGEPQVSRGGQPLFTAQP